MKKQTNSEMNNNIKSSETQPTKKKKKIKVSTIIIIVLVILFLFSCIGNSENSETSTSTAPDTAEIGSTEEKEEKAVVKEDKKQPIEQEEAENVDKSLDTGEVQKENVTDHSLRYVGDEMELYDAESGILLFIARIEEIGILYDKYALKDVLYMNLDITNESKDIKSFYNNAFSLYIDDYQVQNDTNQWVLSDSFDSVIDINPGRKAKFLYCTVLPDDYKMADNIELECAGGAYKIAIVKDGERIMGNKASTINDDENVDGEYIGTYMYSGRGSNTVIEIDDNTVTFILTSGTVVQGAILPSEIPTYIQVSVEGETVCGIEFAEDGQTFELSISSYDDSFLSEYDEGTYQK